jgi:MFS family permease
MHALFASTPAEGISQEINEDGCLATAAVALGLLLLIPATRAIARGTCRLFGRRPAVGLPTAMLGAAAVGAVWGGLVEVLISQYTGNDMRDGYPWVVVLGVLYGLAGGCFFLGEWMVLKEAIAKAKESTKARPDDGTPD